MRAVRRIWPSVIVLVAIAVFSVAGYVLVHQSPVPQAGQMIGYVPATAGSSGSAGLTRPVGRPVVAFLGDDYTAGTGASSQSARFTTRVCQALGLTEKNFGVPRTGYANAGAGAGDYLSRVAAVIAAKPQLVVVSGGRNDVIDNTDTVATDADQLFTQLRDGLPHAVLVDVAPWWGDSAPLPPLGVIAAAARTAVTAAGGTYLDLPDPLRGHPRWMADAADPNDAGYAAIAQSVEAALGPLVAQLPADSPSVSASG